MKLPTALLRLSAAVAALLPLAAFAGTTQVLPEPESWALIGVAAVAALVITIRNRRK